MDVTKVIRVSCDGCDELTLVDDLSWPNSALALCPRCIGDYAVEEEDDTPPPVVDYLPLYFMYNEEGSLLHVTPDFDSPRLWRQFQGSNWWWHSVTSVAVKFFDTEKELAFVHARMKKNLAPRYLDFPDPEKDLEGESDPTIYTVDLDADKKTLEKVFPIRISKEMDLALLECAAKDGSKKAEWARSALYDAIRRA